MNPGVGDQFYPYGEFSQYPQYPLGWMFNMFNDRGNINHSPSTSVTNAESLPESSPQFTDFILKCDCSFPDNFFVTGRFQVGFVLDKSEIAL